MSGIIIHLIRHGQTYGNASPGPYPPKMIIRGDDVLTLKGQGEAQALGVNQNFVSVIAPSIDAVFVSPLRRALRTAIIALSTPEFVASRTAASKSGPIKLLLDPALRELNRNQQAGCDKGLYWRHRGTVLSELQREFDPIIAAAGGAVVVDWSSGGDLMANDRVWWDQDEKTGQCTTDYDDAHWRAHHAVENIRAKCVNEGWKEVVVFGHEGAFRSMSGVTSIANAAILTCRIVAPTIVPCSVWRRPSSNIKRKKALSPDGDPASSLPMTKAMPLTMVKDLEHRGVKDLVVVLGCSDEREATRRMRRGVAAMRCHNDCALVYTGSSSEFEHFLAMMSDTRAPSSANCALGLSEDEKMRVIADQCSRVTECNIDHGLAIATALRPDLGVGGVGKGELRLVVVTNAWHSPRAALIVRDSQQFMAHIKPPAPPTQIAPPTPPTLALLAVPSRPSFTFTYTIASRFMDTDDNLTTSKHLTDCVILAQRVKPGAVHASHWDHIAPLLGNELRELGNNMRRWHAENVAAGGGTDDSLNEVKKVLINAIKRGDRVGVNELLICAVGDRELGRPRQAALALLPLGHTGSTALMYCAAHDQPDIARDLVLIWGADLNARNDKGQDWSWWQSPTVRSAVVEARCLVGR